MRSSLTRSVPPRVIEGRTGYAGASPSAGGLGGPSRSPMSLEQRQVDRVAHRTIAQIARVEMVAAVVDRQHLGRMVGIAQRPVEVGDPVEALALPQPVIDRLAHGLAPRVPGAGQEGLVLERRERAPDDLDAAGLAAHRELL